MSLSESIKTFVQTVFDARQVHATDPLEQLLVGEYAEVCSDFELSKIQESWSWRNVHTARTLASYIIDDSGQIDRPLLFRAIQMMEGGLYSLGPERHHDGERVCHLLKMLKLFYDDPSYPQALKRITHPVQNPVADRLIRQTLQLPENSVIKDEHARRAALAALFTYLRQNVGSCFATAPAIMIQQQQPLQLLTDIAQLFGSGKLMRVYEGVEYVVPLSVSWGMGELLRPISLLALGNNPIGTLALSPGLQAAFEAAALIQPDLSRQDKMRAVAELIEKSGFQKAQNDQFTYFNSDRLIKVILLRAFDVSEEDVAEFSAHQQRGISPMLAPIASLTGKRLACSRFLKGYDAAREAFKALCDNALLKAWEFTLASLSESKADCAKWNLYISLGVDAEEPHGIGQNLYLAIQEKINQINVEINTHQSQYDHLFAQAKYLEGRMARASTESELGWVRAEYQIRLHELNRAIKTRDEVYDKGRKLQGIYPQLIGFYAAKIPEYFQEVYDAEMHDVVASPYDDSPAGFRLMYKFGRNQPAMWSMIHTPQEYIEHLTAFFIGTERELSELSSFEGLHRELSDLVTVVITTIKRDAFLESSFERLARAYGEPLVQNPLQNLERVKRKPWSYVSGGTMSTLVKCYWGSVNAPKQEMRWVESETEYVAFLIDTLKELPLSVQREYRDHRDRSMLATSPTHAFLCKPGWETLRRGWESEVYTYTWIKESFVEPQKRFLEGITLNAQMMHALTGQLLQFIPLGYRTVAARSLNHLPLEATPLTLRQHILNALSYEHWLRMGNRLALVADEFDAILQRSLPLFPHYRLREHLKTLFEAVDEIDHKLKEALLRQFDAIENQIGRQSVFCAHELRQIAQTLLILTLRTTRTPIFYHQKITAAMQNTGLAYPQPLLFADTNWVNNVFGFILNPGTENLELWRFDASGSEGRPMTPWKRYLDGSDRQEWSFYTTPHQYS